MIRRDRLQPRRIDYGDKHQERKEQRPPDELVQRAAQETAKPMIGTSPGDSCLISSSPRHHDTLANNAKNGVPK